jgi:hypothetical protein
MPVCISFSFYCYVWMVTAVCILAMLKPGVMLNLSSKLSLIRKNESFFYGKRQELCLCIIEEGKLIQLIRGTGPKNHIKPHTTAYGTSSVPETRAHRPKLTSLALFLTWTNSPSINQLASQKVHTCAPSQHRCSSIGLH